MSDEADKAQQVKRVVFRTSMFSAALGAVLSPIPFADELVLMPTLGVMAARIGRARGLDLAGMPWKPIVTAITAGLAARAAFNVTVAFIPGVAAVSNAITAAVLTRTLGKYADSVCRAGVTVAGPFEATATASPAA
jgi:uncharacterized protein (DUF697 family)